MQRADLRDKYPTIPDSFYYQNFVYSFKFFILFFYFYQYGSQRTLTQETYRARGVNG